MAVHHTLRNPERAQIRRKEATTRRKARLFYAVDTWGLTKLPDIFQAGNVKRYLWLRLRK